MTPLHRPLDARQALRRDDHRGAQPAHRHRHDPEALPDSQAEREELPPARQRRRERPPDPALPRGTPSPGERTRPSASSTSAAEPPLAARSPPPENSLVPCAAWPRAIVPPLADVASPAACRSDPSRTTGNAPSATDHREQTAYQTVRRTRIRRLTRLQHEADARSSGSLPAQPRAFGAGSRHTVDDVRRPSSSPSQI